jgi:glycosyltransferase involved in cell wall biosynthesis
MCNNIENNIPKEIEELENKEISKFDVIIQNTLPHLFEYDARFGVNIGLIHTECSHWNKTIWPSRINKLDHLLVPSTRCVKNCKESGVTINIDNIGIPDDMEKYNQGYPFLPVKGVEDKFLFYFIGEYIERKNVQMLVSAFNLEFNKNDNVGLILKLNKSGHTPVQLAEKVSKDISEIKKFLKKHSSYSLYPKETIITAKLSNTEINSLHQMGSCFVMPSAGESWCKPAFDALGFGNTPIVTAGIGPSDFITRSTGYLIESVENQCLVSDNPLPYLYTAQQTWMEPSLFSLREQMRKAYKQNRDKKIANSESVVKKYSYENVGQEMKRIINALL